MTPQPPGQPFNPMMGPPPPGMNPLRDAVNVPGILLITYGALSIAYALFGLATNALMGDANAVQFTQIASDPNLPPAVKELVRTMAGSGGKVIGILSNLISMGLGGLVAFGGFQMRNLQLRPGDGGVDRRHDPVLRRVLLHPRAPARHLEPDHADAPRSEGGLHLIS